jgi:hypothetical protein
MMVTKEKITEWFCERNKIKEEELSKYHRYAIATTFKYIQEEVKNSSTPAATKSVCDDCTAYPFDKRGKTPLCKSCKDNPAQIPKV